MGKKIRRRLRKAGERMQQGLGGTRSMPDRTDDDYRIRPQPSPGGGRPNRPQPAPGSGGVVTIGGGIDDVRRPPGFGGSIGQPEGTVRTADFRDSDGDGTDDRDQRRPGGRNIVEKRRRKASKQPGYRPPAGPPGYTYPGMPPRAPEPRPFPGRGRGPVARPQPFPMPGGNDVKDIRGTNDPRNRKGRDRKIRGNGSEPGFNLNDIMDRFNSGGRRPNRFIR